MEIVTKMWEQINSKTGCHLHTVYDFLELSEPL